VILAPFLHYFLAGMLLSDLYVTDWRVRPSTEKWWLWDLAAASALIGYLTLANIVEPVLRRSFVGLLPAIFFGCAGVIRGRLWRRLLSNGWITAVGGMCYTIYLYHHAFIHVLYPTSRWLTVGRSLWANVLLQLVLFGVFVLPLITILYLLFERPFMRRDWFQRFARWVRPSAVRCL
jgi:peptidoglycan/LPS O-acetylase OafA/YrhL